MLIAEIGVNHIGKKRNVNHFVNKLINSNIDGITFQVIKPEILAKLSLKELSKEFYEKKILQIKKSKKKIGIAINNISMVEFFDKQKIDFWKVLSIDFYNKKLIKKLVQTKKKIYISTGFSSSNDIIRMSQIDKNINFIHTSLSSKIEDTNLSAIKSLKYKLGNKISFGLHSKDIDVIYASIFYEPESIFFYVKNSKLKKIYDDKHAIELSNLNAKVKKINYLKKAIGNSKKIKISFKK